MNKTVSTRKVWLPKHGHYVHFTHRDTIRRTRMMAKASLGKLTEPPVTTLPVDCTGNATVSCPLLGNDQYGDCGPVMAAHTNQIRTYGQGHPGFTEMVVNQAALVAQYEQVSGGDNGTNEDNLVGPSGVWTPGGGGVAGDPSAVIADHLDVDVNDTVLRNYVVDNFYTVCVGWSVPDAFLQGFATGTVWPSAMTPDPANGHWTPIADIAGPNDSLNNLPLNGFHRLFTWGGWCWVSPLFIQSVDPECFATFSALQFNQAGYDSHGRHVSDQAAKWVSIGGNAQAVSAIVAMFPAKTAAPPPAPSPPPTTNPTSAVTLAQAQAWATGADGIGTELGIMTKAQAIAAANAGLAKHWPTTS